MMTSWKCLQMTPATPEFCPQLSVHKYFHSEPQQPKGKRSINLVSASSFWPLLSSSQRKSHRSRAAGGAAVSLGRVSFGYHSLGVSLELKFMSASTSTDAGSRIQKERAENQKYLISPSWVAYFSQGRSLSLCSETVPISRVLYLEDTL